MSSLNDASIRDVSGRIVDITTPPIEIGRRERRRIIWSARLDRVRYGRVPIGEATGWTREKNQYYCGVAAHLRLAVEERRRQLHKEMAALEVDRSVPPLDESTLQPFPEGSARQRHEWALRRRSDLRSLSASRDREARRVLAERRLAEIAVELDGIDDDLESITDLCRRAYQVRVEMYGRIRYGRSARKVTEVPPGPPFEECRPRLRPVDSTARKEKSA